MNRGSIRFARSAMVSEYLRYIWSRPAPVRIAVESAFFSHPPVPVPIKKLTKRPSVVASDFNRRSEMEKPGPLGRLGGRGLLSLLLAVFCLVIIGAGPVQAQTSPCPETNVLKFVQFPRTDGGYDVWDSGPFALADDFICTNTGPITDIHLWASWLNDVVDFNTTFWLGIYDDVPAVTNGPVLIPSRPGTNLVWQQYFFPGQYSQSQVAGGIGNFYNPEPPGILGNEVKTYYYCFYPTNPPVQTGTASQPKIYWLSVYAMPSQGTGLMFGWKSAQFRQFDISTRTPWAGVAPITTDWRPNYDLNNIGLDLAFKINTATNQPPPPLCCPETNMVKYVQRLQPPSTNGVAADATANLVLADDFPCQNTGPIKDIRLWGSWRRDAIDPGAVFTLSIWSDVPKTVTGAPSHPGVPLWSETFGPGEWNQCLYTNNYYPFYEPNPPSIGGTDTNVYYFCFFPKEPFVQQGTVNAPTNYWLSVNVQTAAGKQFGWHTSADKYNDVAVWGNGPGFPAAWAPMFDTEGKPLSMAFKVNTDTNQPPPPPCCPETNGVKFIQRPMVPGGLDVNATRNPAGQPLVLADDFLCNQTGPVTDIHLWGSWLQDRIDPNVLFTLSIWSDVPKKTNGTVVVPSHPGVQLWSEPFGPNEYYQCLYTNRLEQFYDASVSAILGLDTNVYYLCFYPKNPFIQQGTATAPTNYWLAVNAQTTAGSQFTFGWHNSYEYYNDTAVWGNGPVPAAWTPMTDPQGVPLSMAFKVTTPTNPPCPTTFICPPNKTNECGTAWTFDDPRATNSCCGTNVTLIIIDTKTNGTCPQFITRNWLVTDCAGNTANCSQTVVIEDKTPPVFTSCPTNRTVECGSNWSFGTPTATDNCCLAGVFIFGTFTNTGICPQIITRVWVAQDCCGNTNVCSQRITIVDTTPPVFTTCPTNRTVECGSNWFFDTPIAQDNCCLQSVLIFGTFTNSPSCPLVVTRVWVAADCCGLTNTCSQTITVVDTTPPVFTFCPSDLTVECGSPFEFGTPVATDNCCLQGVSVFGTFTNGTCPQFITRIWVARDCCGNTNTCKETVTIVDTTPPALTCATNKTVQCGSNWTFDPPTATDRCCLNPAINVLSTITNGLCPQTITRTWVAYDCCNNSNLCSQTVTVIDTTPPTLTCSPDKTVQCGTPWTFDPPTATDNCCTNPVVNAVLTYTNGTTPCDYVISRIYVAMDCCQNTSLACTQRVHVVDTIPPTITCPTNMVIDTCNTNAIVTWTVFATDNCSTNITVTSTPPSGSVFARGTTTKVHVIATDGCGNTNTCDFKVTVERPTLTIVHNPGTHTVTLIWTDGILQAADDVLGPYVDVPLATSPYTVPATGPHRFFRLRCP
jgi:HYR domain.